MRIPETTPSEGIQSLVEAEVLRRKIEPKVVTVASIGS